jgi:pantothenate kinase
VDVLQHEVVIVEGNYLLLDIAPWSTIKDLLDVTVFIECGIEEIERRVYMRHLGTGNTKERALERVVVNDSPNALQVLDCKSRAEYVVQSL